MNRFLRAACLFSAAILAALPGLNAYDNSPAENVIIPECIWAPATGGGTWVTEVQITARESTTVVVTFHYGAGSYRYVILGPVGAYASLRYANMLASLQALDPTFDYSGRVGALFLSASAGTRIWAQARTCNGNYGKTYPGLAWVDGNTANYGADWTTARSMVIQNLTQNATYRSFVGGFNATSGGYGVNVQFLLLSSSGATLGSAFTKSFGSWGFMSFNPFAEAGLGSGTYENCWLYALVTYSGNYAAGSRGVYFFGSSANNYTNDTFAHIAAQFN